MLNELTISAPDPEIGARVQAEIDIKTKPPGSLGRIEALAHQMALAQNTVEPSADPAHLIIFAGDHGMVQAGVSAWPSEVTAQMVLNFLAGGAAANAFADASDARLWVADAGVMADLPNHPQLHRADIRRGTRNAIEEDALTADEVELALAFGADLAGQVVKDGARVLALGEMGIGNTASAALIAHAIDGLDLVGLTGPGAGLDPDGVTRKHELLSQATARRPGPLSPMDALRAFGGLEIAAMAGAMIAGAANRIVVLVDGFIATAAALSVVRARPEIAPYLVFAHKSHEPGHALILDALQVDPLLSLDMRLGEGTGALLAVPLLRAATKMLAQMATFDSAGVSGKT